MQELHKVNSKVKRRRKQLGLQNSYKKVDELFHHHGQLFVSKNIQTQLILRYHNNFLLNYFDIAKSYKFLAQKYY